VITLISTASTLTSPLQFQRSEDVYIISYVELNCHVSLSTITKWTVKNCISNCSYQVHFGPEVSTTRGELFIPGKTLSYGIYELQLTVIMTVSSNLTSSASVYIEINPSDITANLVPYGTSMIRQGYRQNLTLNPGVYSFDPDATIFNASVSLYLCPG
jgi:hypothetical protein